MIIKKKKKSEFNASLQLEYEIYDLLWRVWNQKKKKKEWVQCFFTIGIWNQWLVVESVKSITSFYCPAVPELYGSLKCAFWLLTWKFCLLDDVLLVNSVLCMIADHDLVFGRCRNKEPHSSVVFGRCRNKEPHSSGILLCRVVVVGYEKATSAIRVAKAKFYNQKAETLANPNCPPSKWWQLAKELCDLNGKN